MADQREPDRRERPDREPASTDRPSRVPGPGTEGAEEGFHSAHAPEERRPDIDLYNVAPADMPPASAGADADVGGEAAASRRTAGLPPDLARRPAHRTGEATPGREPILGYDGMAVDDALGWIYDADPGPGLLRRILDYESSNRNRAGIVRECRSRIRRFEA